MLSDRAISANLKRITKAPALPHVSPHDLRRSFARGAYEAGASMELIRQTLGHSNTATTEHYIATKLELDWSASDVVGSAISTAKKRGRPTTTVDSLIAVIDALQPW